MTRQSRWAEVERALAVVLELPEEQRAAFLAKLPAPIRAEVESLLAAHLPRGQFPGERNGRASVRPRRTETWPHRSQHADRFVPD